ncbi:MAG: replication initiator protein [Microviridae sp.]|nr:MAG: replication initiator protein [Microviridae sp.]
MELPCGRCVGCLLERAQSWMLRCMHEAQMHEHNSFLTLTYSTDQLPQDNSLNHKDFQKFIRALRKSTGQKIRYFMCGEYGEPTEKNNYIARPHFHCILFGYDFADKTMWRYENGNRIYRSATLEKFWKKGHSEIGNVSEASCGYVARYCLKKQHGETGKREYAIIEPETGELLDEQRKHPYLCMSKKPGIGESWYKKYKSDVFPHDYCVSADGRQLPVPRYYRKLLEREDPKLSQELRQARIEKSINNPDNTPERLATREFCKQKQADRLIRSL